MSVDAQSVAFESQGYHPKLFRNREREIRHVESRVNDGRRRGLITEPLLNFWGVAGEKPA